ncbi:fmn-binding split barrel-related [Fusarium longipes]|uniref:Fmn-binding split barrel-related n=1 Tax=Fusarium longipes TaxID=694270 RepID=A0A395RR96_9HYPO|nr:fmn-binding split barrel-related [Fusarium longipes]
MKLSHVITGFAATAHALNSKSSIFGDNDNADDTNAAHKIPTVHESVVMARRILALTKLATLSTVFPSGHPNGDIAIDENRPTGLEGVPIGMMDYVADCEDEGNPTILEIKIATTFRNVRAGSNLTLSMNWVPPYPPAKRISLLSRLSAYISFLPRYDYNSRAEEKEEPSSPDTVPYSAANLPRFALFGYLEPINTTPISAVKLAACFTRKHQDAKYWLPGNVIHESSWARLVVTKIYWVGGFGDRARIGWLPVDEWKNVNRDEWESIKLPGEERGWSEWSASTAGEL